METIIVVPAYGRDYKTKKAAKADWDADKDFRINQLGHPHDNRYINKQQKTADMRIEIRFNNATDVLVIE